MLVAIFVVVSVIFVSVFLAALRVPRPNEALIISGLGIRSPSIDGMGHLAFTIVTGGKRTLVVPYLQVVHRLRLDGCAAALDLRYVAPQGIRVQVRGAVYYRIGGDAVSIASAARRFLDEEESMDRAVAEVFIGHLRSILGDLSLESLLFVRDRVAREAENSAADEMSRLGLIIERCDLPYIDDENGYISNLAQQHNTFLTEAGDITQAEQARAEYEQQAAERRRAARNRG